MLDDTMTMTEKLKTILLTTLVFLVVAAGTNIRSLIGLDDVTTSTPTDGFVLRADGTGWVATNLLTADIGDMSHDIISGVSTGDHHAKAISADINHDGIAGVSTSDHHTKAVSSDIDHDSITGVSTGDHHIKPTAGSGLTDTSDTWSVDSIAHSATTGRTSSDHHTKAVSSDIDHGGVGGLTDDDHTQYSLVTAARAFTGNVTIDSASPSLTIAASGAGQGRKLFWVSSGDKYNFMVAANQNFNNIFEITPSTASGGSTYSNPALQINSSGAVVLNDDLTVDGGTLFVDDSLNRVGIGDLTPSFTLDVNGTLRVVGEATFNDDVTIDSPGILAVGGVGDSTFAGNIILDKAGVPIIKLRSGGTSNALLIGGGKITAATTPLLTLTAIWIEPGGTENDVAGILFESGADTTNKDDGEIAFSTSATGSLVERLRLENDWGLTIPNGTPSNTTNKLYASGGDLYWNGVKLN